MANELLFHYSTGSTLYVLLSDATGQVYNGSTFEAPASANWATYDIAMTEAATATGIYRASMPAVAAGAYGWVVRKQAGGSSAVSDVTVGAGSIRWTGTAEEAVPASVNVTLWAGATAPAMTGDAYARLGAPAGASVSADIAAVDSAVAAAILETPEQRIVTDSSGRVTVFTVEGNVLGNVDGTIGDLASDARASIRAAIGMAAADLDTQLDAVAKMGADGDTLETLSDQIDAVKVDTAAILEDTARIAASGAVTVISTVSGGTITVYVADTWSFTVTDSTLDLSGYEAVALSVKRNARQADAEALLYLRSDTGLQRIGGATPVSAGNGTLSKTATSFTALVALAETGGLTAGQYTWWLKGFDTTPTPDTGFTLATGAFVLERAGLAAVA